MSMKQSHSASTPPALDIGTRAALVLLGACWLSACQTPETHELGYTQSSQDLEVEPTEPFFGSVRDFVGHWVGEATDPLALRSEAGGEPPLYRFPSGSTRFTLDITHGLEPNGGPTLTGKITFGEGEPPPLATDPDVGYPVGLNYGALLSYVPPAIPSLNILDNYDDLLPPFEGFAYALGLQHRGRLPDDSAAVPDGIARFIYNTNDVLQSWCALQTPHPTPVRGGYFSPLPYSPPPNQGFSNGLDEPCELRGPEDLSACPADLSSLSDAEYYSTYQACRQPGPLLAEVSCDKYWLSQYCLCMEDHCFPSYQAAGPAINLRASPDGLVGVFDNASFKNPRGLATPLGEVRFRRVSDAEQPPRFGDAGTSP